MVRMVRASLLAALVAGATVGLTTTGALASSHSSAASSRAVLSSTNPLLPSSLARKHARPTAREACGNVCILADAYPEWICVIQGTVVAAGVYIAAPEAGALWNILAGGIWTAGCSAIDSSVLSSGNFNKLLAMGRGCYIEWTREHKYSNTKCVSYYA